MLIGGPVTNGLGWEWVFFINIPVCLGVLALGPVLLRESRQSGPLASSAIGTLVERTTRFTMLLHLPPMEGRDILPRTKNGPPLAGHGAEAVRDAIATTITALPDQLRKSLTWDQGAEIAEHAKLASAQACRSISATCTAPGNGPATRTL